MATLVSKILVRLMYRDRRIAYAQIEYVFGKSVDKQKILQESFKNSILSVFEVVKIKSIFQVERILPTAKPVFKSTLGKVSTDNVEIPHEIISQGKNALCLTSHYSNFDLLAAYFAYQGLRMSVMARTANNLDIQSALNELRLGYGVEMLWRESKDSSALLKAIRNKHMICALLDQDINLENEFSPFFGIEAAYPAAPIQLAIRLKLPVISCIVKREHQGNFKIHLERIHWEDKEDKVQYILEQYGKLLENYILENPYQWVWWHRRWRRRPGIDYDKQPELLPSTDKYIEWLGTKKFS